MIYKYILFDLDGTLTDPAIGITNSFMYALKKFGIEANDRSDLYKVIGPPLKDSFEKFYGFSEEETNKAIGYYREYYKDKGIYENTVYDGIEDLLKALKEKNKILIVATSKPEVFAKQILDHFDISKYFTFIAGCELDGTRGSKEEVIRYALESCNINDLSEVLMIGDREYDILGAKKVGIKSLGVLYGYGDRNEMENAGADYIVDNIAEIKKYIH